MTSHINNSNTELSAAERHKLLVDGIKRLSSPIPSISSGYSNVIDKLFAHRKKIGA